MEDKREEIYERIPWERIESQKGDKQTLIIGLAAAIVVGALAYSYMSGRSVDVAPVTSQETVAVPPPQSAPAPVPAAPFPTTPQVIAEADLYAVAPDRLAWAAAGYAEWFVMEYLTAGAADEASFIRKMLSSDIPVPSFPEGSVVFVEWLGALSIEDLDVGRHSVEVLVRYLVSRDGGAYERADPEVFRVEVAAVGTGFEVIGAPEITAFTVGDPSGPTLGEVPAEVIAQVAQMRPDARIVGGTLSEEGSWRLVVVGVGPGGIQRPESFVVSPEPANPPVSP